MDFRDAFGCAAIDKHLKGRKAGHANFRRREIIVTVPARVNASGEDDGARGADRLKDLLVELTNARDLAHTVPDSDHIIYIIEMALMEVTDRSRVVGG